MEPPLLPEDLEALKKERERLVAQINRKWKSLKAHHHSLVESEDHAGSTTSDYSTETPQSHSPLLEETDSSNEALHKRIEQLEHSLKTVTSDYEHLKHKYSSLVRQHKSVLQQCKQQLANYRSQVKTLEKETASFRESADSEKLKADSLAEQVTTLRELLVNESAKSETANTRIQEDSKFMDIFSKIPLQDFEQLNLTTPPPQQYKHVPQHDLSIELAKTKAQLIKSKTSTDSLFGTLSKLKQQHETLQEKHKTYKSKQQTAMTQMQSQLAGAVRRIQWLLLHQKSLDSTIAQKDLYIKKLEDKLLALAKQSPDLTQLSKPHVQSLIPNPSHPPTKPRAKTKQPPNQQNNRYQNQKPLSNSSTLPPSMYNSTGSTFLQEIDDFSTQLHNLAYNVKLDTELESGFVYEEEEPFEDS